MNGGIVVPIVKIELNEADRTPFLQLSHKIIRDSELSDQALGLLVRLMILKDDWNFHYTGYTKIYPKSKATRLATSMNELKQLGYVKYERQRDNRGYFQEGILTLKYNACLKKETTENPDMENPKQE